MPPPDSPQPQASSPDPTLLDLALSKLKYLFSPSIDTPGPPQQPHIGAAPHEVDPLDWLPDALQAGIRPITDRIEEARNRVFSIPAIDALQVGAGVMGAMGGRPPGRPPGELPSEPSPLSGVRNPGNREILERLATENPKQAGMLRTVIGGGQIAKPSKLFSPLAIPENMRKQLEFELATYDQEQLANLAQKRMADRQRILNDPQRAQQLVELANQVQARRQPGVERGLYVGQASRSQLQGLASTYPSFDRLLQEGVTTGKEAPPYAANMGETVLGRLPSGGYVQEPTTQVRLAHMLQRGLSSPEYIDPTSWGHLRDALLPAFGGDPVLANRFADVVASMSPSTPVTRNAAEAAAYQYWRLTHPDEPFIPITPGGDFLSALGVPAEQGGTLGMPESKIPNANRAFYGLPMSGDKVASMGGYNKGAFEMPIDTHWIRAHVGPNQSERGVPYTTLSDQLPFMKARIGGLEGRPFKGPRGEADVYEHYVRMMNDTLEAMSPGMNFHNRFGTAWEGTRLEAPRPLPFEGSFEDVFRRVGLLDQGAMLDPGRLLNALLSSNWKLPAILALFAAIRDHAHGQGGGQRGDEASTPPPTLPGLTAPAAAR